MRFLVRRWCIIIFVFDGVLLCACRWFPSLATIPDDGNKGVPVWPSPRHRVNCPSLKGESGDDVNGNQCRRSLVYFAYPPPGISLDDARRFVVPISSSSSSLLTDRNRKDVPAKCELPSLEIYDRYSLLHNQSHHPLPLGHMLQCDEVGNTDRKTLDKGGRGHLVNSQTDKEE